MFGSTKKIKKDVLADDVNNLGRSGIGMLQSGASELNDKIYNNSENYVENQIGRENMALRSAADDASRRTRELIARRGMGNSSIGLGQEVNQARGLNESIALNNASGLDQLRGILSEKMNVGNQLLSPKLGQGPLQMTNLKYKTGGMGKMLGTAVGTAAGAYFGGPAGAAAGAQAGSSLGGSLD